MNLGRVMFAVFLLLGVLGCDSKAPTPTASPAATPSPTNVNNPSPTPVTKADPLPGAKRPGDPVKLDEFNDRARKPPKRGGEIIQAVHVGFRALDAELDNSALTSEVCHIYIQEGLVDMDETTWKDTPKLAERWDIEDNLELTDGKVVRGKVTETADGYEVQDLSGKAVATPKKSEVKEVRYQTSFTFHLRKGVKFHDGQDFTSKDVVFTYKLLSNPKNGMPSIQGYLDKISECVAIDDHTVRMTYKEQYWMALTVCGGYVYIRPHKAWDPDGLLDKDPDAYFQKFKEHPLLMKPIGTGPYEFDSFKKDFEVVVKRNENYWDPKSTKQYPDRIRFRIIKDPVAQLQALKNGEIDYVTQIPMQQFDDFFAQEDNAKRFAAVTIVYPTYGYIGFNLRKEMWKDKNLRLALAYGSADLPKFIQDVLKGRAVPVTGDYYLFGNAIDPTIKPIPFDPKKAESILSDAGWFDSDGDGIIDKGGKKLDFEMLVRDMPDNTPVMQHLLKMQSNLKNLGIKMNLRKLEWTAFLEKIDRGECDVFRLGWAMSSPPDKTDLFQIWHSSSIGESGSNHVSYSNPEVDRLLVDIRRELDEAKRNKMCQRVQRILFEDQPYNWLYMPAEHRAYTKKWQGVRFWVPKPCSMLGEWYLAE